VANFKVFRIFILIKKFILFIFRSLDLREGIKTHYKMLKERELLVSHILPTRNEVFFFFVSMDSSLSLLKYPSKHDKKSILGSIYFISIQLIFLKSEFRMF
jgi:hypothetical protein